MESSEQNKLTNEIEPSTESWNRLTAIREEWGGGDWLREGAGISHRTHMYDPRTWTMVWGLTVGVGADWVGGQRRKH